jgi:septal ring factor EnvC (AmiA/AmiB activator)
MRKSIRGRGPDPRREVRKLARINTKISRLSSELETLQFVQDRLERKLESAERSAARDDSKNAPSGKKSN